MAQNLPFPLGGPTPEDVSLKAAPLIKVLTEVRFPSILRIESKEAVTSFQERVREQYPFIEQEFTQQIHVQIGPGAPVVNPVPGSIWRFWDIERRWRMSLSVSSISLETEQYGSRDEFLLRLVEVLTAVESTFAPRIALRTGMRYIDRVIGEPFKSIDKLLRPGVLGVITPEMHEHVRHAMTEATFKVAEGEMSLRWGILPPNFTIDPGLFSPIPQPSWVLDIDVYSSVQQPFDSQKLTESFRKLAERAYSVFRFMTTEQFLKTYEA